MKRSGYGVKLVRGPFVRLPPHPRKAADIDSLVQACGDDGRPTAVDLFCGAGGLSLGLSDAGFDVVLGIDNDPRALETHAHMFAGVSCSLDLGDDEVVTDLIARLRQLRPTLIAGGPPCQPFSRAGASKIRALVTSGQRDAHDPRRELWRAFLRIVSEVRPPAALLENVPDMALGGRMEIVRTIVHELERIGYAVHTRLLHAWQHGVPQYRQRFIMVALADSREFLWPEPTGRVVTVADAIGDLPPVEGGARPEGGADGWWPWEEPAGGLNAFVARAREGLDGEERHRIRDHITRPVRPDDREVFELMSPDTLYSDLPGHLKRYRDDIFDDKYKRLDPDQPSRSITAHIARDGYWYIHPEQPRTLTVREAARLQTFPDRMRFAGPPSAAFRQIGNAVPPRLAEVVGSRVLAALAADRPSDPVPSSIETARALATWVETLPDLVVPWAVPPSAWTVVLGVQLLGRCSPSEVARHWPVIAELVDPRATLENVARLRQVAAAIGRVHKLAELLAVAERLVRHVEQGGELDETALSRVGKVSRDLAYLAVGLASAGEPGPVPVTGPLLRLVGRFTGLPVHKERSRSDGRLEIARLVGGTLMARPGDARPDRALGGAVEAAARVCTVRSPRCGSCPLEAWCRHARSTPRPAFDQVPLSGIAV